MDPIRAVGIPRTVSLGTVLEKVTLEKVRAFELLKTPEIITLIIQEKDF